MKCFVRYEISGELPLKKGNELLRQHRLDRGWSRAALVTLIQQSLSAEEGRTSGLVADHVRRWENGERRPSPQYRKHLVKVFGLSASELGLLSKDDVVPTFVGEQHSVERSETDQLAEKIAAKVLSGIDQRFHQRSSHVVGEGAGHMAVSDEAATEPATSVDYFAASTVANRLLLPQAQATRLMPLVTNHIDYGRYLLNHLSGSPTRAARLAAGLAESALLAARLSFFDLGDVVTARQYFKLASQYVTMAGSVELAAAIAAHRAFVPGFNNKLDEAQELLAAARLHASEGADLAILAWIECVHAEIAARCGDTTESIKRLDVAAELHGQSDSSAPGWFDFFDAGRLNGFAGGVLVLAGRPAEAIEKIEAAIASLPPGSDKQESVFLFDLALARAVKCLDHAAATAHEAVSVWERTQYDAARPRIAAMKAVLAETPHGQSFSERIEGYGRDC